MRANSSIPPRRSRRLRGLFELVLCRRTFVTLSLGALLIVATAAYRDRGEFGLPLFRYDQVRRSWHHCADGAAGGDSRVQRGVAPSVMAPKLGAARLVNLAYPHAALTSDYLARLDDALDPDCESRVIILGVTPASLTSTAAGLSEFARERSRSPWDVYREPFEWFFKPYAADALSRALLTDSRKSASYLSPDGWRAASTREINADQEARKLRTFLLAGNADPIDPRIVDDLMAWVRRWSAAGVRVYGFRPPTNPETVAAENLLYDFDESRFAAGFEKAGGVWLCVAPDAYETYDGSHLLGAAAVGLSEELARQIAAVETAQKPREAK